MINRGSFVFLRHGQTDWNVEGRVQGRTDVPLNETGRLQAHDARKRLQDAGITRICCSPLDRARETAGIVNRDLGCPVEIIEELAEADWGTYEGGFWDDWFEDWVDGMPFAGIESYEGFLLRAATGINKALKGAETVLIVAHGGVYWSVQHYLLREPRGIIPNSTPILHAPVPETVADWHVSALNMPYSVS